MAKTCLFPECKSARFSHGYCQRHQQSRSDSDWVKKQEDKKVKMAEKMDKANSAETGKRSLIRGHRPRVVRKPTHSELTYPTIHSEAKEAIATQSEIFMEIWEERPHVSFLSGRPINIMPGTDLWYVCFAHVLSKALNKFPRYKLYKPNVQLLLPEEHTLLDHGYSDQRERYAKEYNCDWNKIYELSETLKLQYPYFI